MSKISELDKQGLQDYMKSNGEIHRPSDESAAWKRAFRLYEISQGIKLDMDCSRCWKRVSEWIRS